MSRDVCWLCGRWGETERHHIFPGGRRALSERYRATVQLCSLCHREGGEAVHRCGATRERVQRWGQEKVMAEQGWTAEQFRAVFGKNYL